MKAKTQNQIREKEFIDKAMIPEPDDCHGRAIFDFNKMLRGGKMKTLDCYRWLENKQRQEEAEFENKHGFHMDMSFKYLYPEVIGPMPDTYEEWKEKIIPNKDEVYIDTTKFPLRSVLVEKYGEEKVNKTEKKFSELMGKPFKFK